MKIQPLLLQTIGIALFAAACNPAQTTQPPLSAERQQHTDTPQQRLSPPDTAITIDSTSSRAITPDYCPPCGRG